MRPESILRSIGVRRLTISLMKRTTMTSTQAELFNNLLDTVEEIHSYAGEKLDAGPAGEDQRVVAKAIEEGPVSSSEIKALKKAEKAAEAAVEAPAAEAPAAEAEKPADAE